MELHAEHRKRVVLYGRDGTGRRLGQRNEIIRNTADLIAMAHPDIKVLGNAVQKIGRQRHVAAGSAKFASRDVFHFSAKRLAGQLHSVADSQDRYAEAEDSRVALWS